MTTNNELPPQSGEAHFDSISDELRSRFIETLSSTVDELGFFAKPDGTEQKIVGIRFGNCADCELNFETATSRGVTTTTIIYKDSDYGDRNFTATNSPQTGLNWRFTRRALGETEDTAALYTGKGVLGALGQYWPRMDGDTADIIKAMVADEDTPTSSKEIADLLRDYAERQSTGSRTDTSAWYTYGYLGNPLIQRSYQQIFQLSASAVSGIPLNMITAQYVTTEIIDGHSRLVTYMIAKDELDDLSVTAFCPEYGTDSDMSLAVQDYDKVYQNLQQFAEQAIREKAK